MTSDTEVIRRALRFLEDGVCDDVEAILADKERRITLGRCVEVMFGLDPKLAIDLVWVALALNEEASNE